MLWTVPESVFGLARRSAHACGRWVAPAQVAADAAAVGTSGQWAFERDIEESAAFGVLLKRQRWQAAAQVGVAVDGEQLERAEHAELRGDDASQLVVVEAEAVEGREPSEVGRDGAAQAVCAEPQPA